MTRLSAVTFSLILVIATGSFAGQQARHALPPTKVMANLVSVTTLPVTLQWPVSCPCTLQVTNGATPSSPLSPTRVLGAWVWVDSTLVLTPIQLSFLNGSATANLNLGAGPHSIKVQLVGLQRSYVTVSLAGTARISNLSAPRADHSATLLPDGQVLVAGGANATGVLDATELLADDAGTTTPASPLAGIRAAHGAALIAGHTILLTGGRDHAGELFDVDVRTAAGSSTGLPLDASRRDHTATTLLDGRVLILGGTDASGTLDSGLALDPRPDPFTDNQYDPIAAVVTNLGVVLQVPRAGHTATLLSDGRILVAGGRNGATDLASMELVDPDTMTSTPLPVALATARSDHSASLRADGSILVAGGRHGTAILGSIEVVRPALDGVAPGGSLARARAGHSATTIRNGEVLIAGGWTAAGITAHTELAPPPPADGVAPAIVAIAPADNAADVDRGIVVTLQLSEPVNPATVDAASISIRDGVDAVVPAAVGIVADATMLAIRPDALLPGDLYTVTVNGVTDRGGNALAPFSFTFTTVPSPSITAMAPTQGPAGTEVTLTGSGFSTAAPDNRVAVGATQVAVTPVSTTALTFTAPAVPIGTYPITLRTRGGSATAPVPFTLVGLAPTLSAISPAQVVAGSGSFTLALTGTNFVNGATVVAGATALSAVYASPTSLEATVPAAAIATAGVINVQVVNPAPGGGASNALPLTVESAGPALTAVTIFPRGMRLSVGGSQTFSAEARYADGSRVNISDTATWQSGAPAILSVNASGHASAMAAGDAAVTVTFGGQSATATLRVYEGESIPPDPADVAPPLSPTESTPVIDSTRFLYEGENPIQRGVAPGTIQASRAAVIRGVVLDRDGQPIEGAHVAIANQPELGHTLTRLDGGYDLVINGGGSVVVEYTKAGALPIERRLVVPSGDMAGTEAVVLVGLDPQVTAVSLGAPGAIQVAQGSVVTDESGTRRATLLFEPSTNAVMRLPNGTTQSLTNLHVRATEYTVGPSGPGAMPGALPATSAYTYAVELSVDEAIAAGATTVEFSQPVPVYVENFLGFPAGVAVPCGTYNREAGSWEACDDGVVLEIVSIDGGGRAELDVDGDGNADGPAALSAIGITDQERATLAGQYPVGQSLWRVPVRHFSPHDFNWGASLTADAQVNPRLRTPEGDGNSRTPSTACGSIIECQDQVLGESVPVAGTPFSLNYRSDRVPGRLKNWLRIPLTEATVPVSMQSIGLEIRIAGRRIQQDYPASAGQVAEFAWDGLDAYGRRVEGPTPVEVKVLHRYPWFYAPGWLAPGTRTFAIGGFFQYSGPPEVLRPGGRTPAVVPASTWKGTLQAPPRASASVGGWSFDVHHVYEPRSGTLYLGDGSKRVASVAAVGPPVTMLDDLEPYQYLDAVVANDAIYYKTDYGYGSETLFRKVSGQPAMAIGTVEARRFTVDRRTGTVYYAHCPGGSVFNIYRIPVGESATLDSTLTLPAGDFCNDWVSDVEIAPDGTLYAASNYAVFQRSPGTQFVLREFDDSLGHAELAIGANGVVYRAAFARVGRGFVIDRLEPGGGFTRIAGDGVGEGYLGDGGLAVGAKLGVVDDVAVAADGSVLFADFDRDLRVERVRRVTPDGVITTIAGASPTGLEPLANGSPATGINFVNTIDVGPDGWIYLFADYNYKMPPELVSTPARVVSDDGSEYYEFSPSGRHLRTIHALTGGTVYEFGYDLSGYLVAVTDGDGLVTRVHRNGQGAATGIEGPYGQTTAVVQDANGWLSRLVAPGNRTTTFTSTAAGLLTGMVDANGGPWAFTYDAQGLLTNDSGPAGASETLARTPTDNGWDLTRTSAMDRQRTYRTELLDSGAQRVRITEADGTVTEHTAFENGRRESVAPEGTRTLIETTPDPDGGFGRPVPSLVEVTTPAGLTLNVLTERYKYVATPGDFSTTETWDYATINGRTSETYYNGATRTFTTTSPAGRITTSTIDLQGRVTRTQVGSLTPVDFTYDSQGRLSTTAQGTRQSSITYDAQGRPAVLTDALTRTVTFGYDAADRVTAQTLPDARVIGFGYDANSNVTALTPPGRPAHTFTYTPINFTSAYVPPPVAGTGPTGYVFNADRQPTEVQRPDGQTTTFSYGATSGRLESVTFSRGQLTYGYDAAGRVSTLNDPGGVNLAFTFDGPLPLTETWSGPVEGAVSRTFTSNFELATEQVNGAHAVAFGYDDDRLLTSAGALAIARDAGNGLVSGTTLGSTVETHEYNEFGEPSRQTSGVNSTQVFDVQIARDPLGRIAQRIEVVDGLTRVFQYGYDLAGRLENVTRNGDLVVHYTYDANGNRLSAEGEAGLVTGTYDDQDRLLTYGGASYTYTANGELATKTVAGQTTSYVYDTLGNLMQVAKPSGDLITYTIDGRGRRVGKSINGTRVKGWLYADQLRPIAELDGAGDVVSRFVYGTRPNVPDYIIKNGTTYRVFSDHLGSPRVIVDAATGAIVQRMDFQAFGEIIQDSSPGWQPFGFAGGLYDPDTGLIRYGFRDYNPAAGKWTQPDPIGFLGGDTNLYSYSLADPINNIDPTGLAVPVIGAVVGGVVGGMTGALSAYGTDQSSKQILMNGLFGALTGAVAGAMTSSSLFLGAVNALGETINQLVSSVGCGKLNLNPAAIGAAALAGVAGGKGAQLLDLLPALAQQPAVLREMLRALPGLGASGVMLPATAAGQVLNR